MQVCVCVCVLSQVAAAHKEKLIYTQTATEQLHYNLSQFAAQINIHILPYETQFLF